jgi:hypothetical protein
MIKFFKGEVPNGRHFRRSLAETRNPGVRRSF